MEEDKYLIMVGNFLWNNVHEEIGSNIIKSTHVLEKANRLMEKDLEGERQISNLCIYFLPCIK